MLSAILTIHICSMYTDYIYKESMKSKFCSLLIVYLFFAVSGSLYCIGEKTISLGGASSWALAERRSGVAEVNRVRSHPVLLLAAAGSPAGNRVKASLTGFAPDLSLSFDEGNTALFKDGAAHYRLAVSPLLEAVDRRHARAGNGAALFSAALAAGSSGETAKSGGALAIEPQSKAALFAPNNHIGDFTLEFWLYPLNMENGEQILSWASSCPFEDKGGNDYVFQRILCVASKNRLQWSFLHFFTSPDNTRHINISVEGKAAVVPKTWSHHLIRFDSATGMLEYLVNGVSEAIEYASFTGHEGGEVYPPIAGEGGSFTLGGNFMGLMDEFKIHSAWVGSPILQRYPLQGGRIETRPIDLGQGSSGVLAVEASGGRTSAAGARSGGEFKKNGRFRFSDESEMQFFIRSADNPYQWDERDWRVFIPGADLAGNIRGRYVQVAVDFYPSADGESSPYLEELRIIYQPNEPPLPPGALTAVAMDGAIQLHWKNSPDANTAGYLVYYGLASGEYLGEDAILGASPIDAGKRNSIFIDGLKNGTLYYFRVAAYDRQYSANAPAFHAGEFSREARARPLQGLSSLSSLRMPE
jgi:hypothetical protein